MLVGSVLGGAAPATGQSANFGPVLGPLPASASGGGQGTAALDQRVSSTCASGAALGNPRWFSLPTDDTGLLSVEGQELDTRFLGHGAFPVYATFAALVDPATSTVLACPGRTASVTTAKPLAAVVWVSYADATGFATETHGGTPQTTVRVRRTSGTPPANGSPATALPISALPFEYRGDSTAAPEDGAGLGVLPVGCVYSSISPSYDHMVWFSWTAANSADIVARAFGDDTDQQVLVFRATAQGLVSVDPVRNVDMCSTGHYRVSAGASYVIAVAGYHDEYMYHPFPDGGYYGLYVGPSSGPTADLGVHVSSTSATATVTWSGTGAAAGQAATTSFVVRAQPLGLATAPVQVAVSAPASSATLSGLVPGRTYRVSVSAINAAGIGAPQGSVITATSAVLPEPRSVDATVDASAGTATLTWSQPGSALAISGYVVGRDGVDANGTGPWSTTVPATASSLTFTALKQGSTYRFSVHALSSAGVGAEASVAVRVLTSPVLPSSVQGAYVTVDRNAHTATVTWELPDYDGQSPITHYAVNLRPFVQGAAAATASTGPQARTYTFANIDDTVPYTIAVQAQNAVGIGPETAQTFAPSSIRYPSEPRSPTAVAADGSAALSWLAPADQGSLPLTGYVVRLYAAGSTVELGTATVSSSATSTMWEGLANGTSYTFAVSATSFSAVWGGGGEGPLSVRSVVFVPAKPPQPVVTVPQGPRIKSVAGSVVKGRTVATVRWAAPSNGGKPILGYRVYAYKVDAAGHVLSSTRTTTISASRRSWSMTFSGVSRYRFAMRAVNAIGWSAYGGLSTTMAPASAPSAPRMGRATSGVPGGAVTASVTWSAPRSNGGTVVTGYRVFIYQLSAGGDVLSVTTSSLLKASARSWTGRLPAAGPYAFAVRAVNAMGQSRASARSSTVTGR